MADQGGMAVIFWGPHSVCTESFARYFKAPLYLIHYLSWKKPLLAPIKYPLMWVKTWIVLARQRPSAVFVVNTPVFAPLCVYAYCRVANIPYVMNVHGHTLSGRKWGWSRPLQRFLGKRALTNLVGTTEYEQVFKGWGANTLFLEDPPLEIISSMQNQDLNRASFSVTVVNTFAGDEPLDLMLDAARTLPDICFYILGDKSLADPRVLDSAPGNVHFTGYLRGRDYWDRLYDSHAIMTLTTNPYSLVAGGIEGMSAGRPLILSRQPALVDYFTSGTVFVDHTADSLVEGIRQAQRCEGELSREIAALSIEKREKWEMTFQTLVGLIGEAGAVL